MAQLSSCSFPREWHIQHQESVLLLALGWHEVHTDYRELITYGEETWKTEHKSRPFIRPMLTPAPGSLAWRGGQVPKIRREVTGHNGNNSAASDSLAIDCPTLLLHTGVSTPLWRPRAIKTCTVWTECVYSALAGSWLAHSLTRWAV